MRRTLIELTDELAIHTRTQTAVADGYRIVRVWISTKVKNALHRYEASRIEVDSNLALKEVQKWYDLDLREFDLIQSCGMFLDQPVFVDPQLEGYSMLLESIPNQE